MILLNELEKICGGCSGGSTVFIERPASIPRPHMTQELWSLMGSATYLDFEPWPTYDPALTKDATVSMVFQVNGKIRDTMEMDAGVAEEKAKAAALANTKVRLTLGGQVPKKVIYVKDKLVNIVV